MMAAHASRLWPGSRWWGKTISTAPPRIAAPPSTHAGICCQSSNLSVALPRTTSNRLSVAELPADVAFVGVLSAIRPLLAPALTRSGKQIRFGNLSQSPVRRVHESALLAESPYPLTRRSDMG